MDDRDPRTTAVPSARDEELTTVRIDVLDGLAVTVDGAAVHRQQWERRRKPQLVLALLVAAGGHLDRGAVVDELWPDELPAQGVRNPLSVALSVARGAIVAGTGPAAHPAQALSVDRWLALDAHGIELVLASRDSTDIGDVRAVISSLAGGAPPTAELLIAHVHRLLPLLQGVPLRGLGSGRLTSALRSRMADDLRLAAKLVVERWIALGERAGRTPVALLELARIASRLDPCDESLALDVIELHVTARGRAAASPIYHGVVAAMRDHHGVRPSVVLSRRYAAILAG